MFGILLPLCLCL